MGVGWGEGGRGRGGGMGRVFDSLYIVKELLACLIVSVNVFDCLCG